MEYKYYKLLDENKLVIENKEETKVVLFDSKDNELKYKRKSLVPYYLLDSDQYDQIEEIDYNNYLLEIAKIIVTDKFKDLEDKGNKPYIIHLEFVANEAFNNSNLIEAKIVSYLHDLIEDTDFTLFQLEKIFPENITYPVKLLTKSKNIKYKNYIHNIKENNIAKSVKLADLKHNSKLDRLDRITERDIQRNKKYLEAIDYLES